MKTRYLIIVSGLLCLAGCKDDKPSKLGYEDIYGYPYPPSTSGAANGSFFIEKATDLTFNETDRTEESAVYSITTTGTNPSFTTERIEGALSGNSCVLTFKYKSNKKITPVISLNVSKPAATATMGEMAPAGEWTEYSWDLGNDEGLIATTGWGSPGSYFRITLAQDDYSSGANIEIKDLRIRDRTAEEQVFATAGQWVRLTTVDGGGFYDVRDITFEEGGFNLLHRNVYKVELATAGNWIRSLPFPRPFENGEQVRLKFEYKSERQFALLVRLVTPDWQFIGPSVINPISPSDEWATVDAELGDFYGVDQSQFSANPLHIVFYYEPEGDLDVYVRGMHFYAP